MTKRSFLVPGATKGIGRALSTRLADAGHQVVGLARNEDPTFPGTMVAVDLGNRGGFITGQTLFVDGGGSIGKAAF
jgi:3-oxoacyl-[acyl-carrier protein] reductase